MKSKINLLSILLLLCLMTVISCEIQDNNTSVTATSPLRTPMPVEETLPLINTPTQYLTNLSKEEALNNFIKIIEEGGGGCSLPCWLGVTPGQTRFNDTENIFLQFSPIAVTKYSQESVLMKIFYPEFETMIYSTSTNIYHAADGKVDKIWVFVGMSPYADGKWDYGNLLYQKTWKPYFAPGIFTEYGMPEKIFVDTTLIAADNAASYPFTLWLVYPQQGFLIRYQGVNEKNGDNIKVCPMKSRIEMIAWDIKLLAYEDIIKEDSALGGISLGPQLIEKVTDFSVETFFETYKNGNLDTCFETPAAVWPPN